APSALTSQGKVGYSVDLNRYGVTAPSDAEGTSGLVLLEDGRPLPYPHQIYRSIQDEGQGRYSHWGTGAVFSATDNSDPRTNGRVYTARVPRRLGLAASELAMRLHKYRLAQWLRADFWLGGLALLLLPWLSLRTPQFWWRAFPSGLV